MNKKSEAIKAAIAMIYLTQFAEAGTLVNATTQYVNAYDGQGIPFSGPDDLSAEAKTFYVMTMLDNTRPKYVFTQLGDIENLPAGHGQILEWRKPERLPLLDQLTEGVIPAGKKLGVSSLTVQIAQYGMYVALSDKLKLHSLDKMVVVANQEVGDSAQRTNEILCRNELMQGTNIIFADAYDRSTGAYVSTPSTESALQTALASYNCNLTPDMINKAATNLQNFDAPTFDGSSYVAVVHPHVAYDLRKHPDWVDYHKYAAVTEIFSGEIGELHGVRFIASTLAPIIKKSGQTYATYKTLFFGAKAFKTVNVEGGAMQMYLKDAKDVGGPLEQFSTTGVKMETATKIVYQERMVAVWHGSSYSSTDAAN